MSNPYREPRRKDYTGEHFQAIHRGEYADAGTEWTIYQLEPRLWIAQTGSYMVAVELVNRLDVTGDQGFGEEY